jgi:hypothetical protein
METLMENIRKEVATEYPDGIFARADLAFIYKDILNQDLHVGRDLILRFDWCNQNQFVVNYMVSDSLVSYYKKYRKLSKDEFVEKLMEETDAFAMGTRNSILDIHFAIGENHDLYYIYSKIRNDPNTVSKHKKNCGEGFLVYTPSQPVIVKDLPPVQNKDDDTITEDLSDEPEEEAVEEEKEHDIGIPATKLPAQTEHENAVDNLMEEEKKKQAAKMNENKLIVQKIDDVIGELKKIVKRDVYNHQQFSKVSRKYEEMKTYIDEYINNNLINYETNINTDPELHNRYEDFKKKWHSYFEWRLKNQYAFLTQKYADTVSFLSKRNDFIYMLKELRNHINVNLFGKPAVWGGKTKRRYRRKTIRKRVSKKQTKKFRRID